MDVGVIGVFIPILGILTGLTLGGLSIWTQHKRKIAQLEIQARKEAGAYIDTKANTRIAELEDRMRVLERIVTDKGYDLAHQIEALREDRALEEFKRDRDKV
jgi:hypothetical protein